MPDSLNLNIPDSWARFHYKITPASIPATATGAYCALPRPHVDGHMISDKYDQLFQHAADVAVCKPDWRILKAIAASESGPNLDINATGHTSSGAIGGVGIMQINPNDQQYTIDQLRDPALNIQLGAQIYCDKLRAANGDVPTAIKYYKGWPLRAHDNPKAIAQYASFQQYYNSITTMGV